jgi:hypothetical protein
VVRWAGLQTIQSVPEGYNRRRASAPVLHRQNASLRSVAFLFARVSSRPRPDRWCGRRRRTSWHTRLGSCPRRADSLVARSALPSSAPGRPPCFPQARSWPCCTRSPVRGLPRPEKQPAYLAALAIYPGDCYATTNFLDADFGGVWWWEGCEHPASTQRSRGFYPVGDTAWRRDDGGEVGLPLGRIRERRH